MQGKLNLPYILEAAVSPTFSATPFSPTFGAIPDKILSAKPDFEVPAVLNDGL